MRFYKFLNEMAEDEVKNILRRDCQKFLNILPKGQFLYRRIRKI